MNDKLTRNKNKDKNEGIRKQKVRISTLNNFDSRTMRRIRSTFIPAATALKRNGSSIKGTKRDRIDWNESSIERG